MKKLIFIALMLFSSLSFADRVDDLNAFGIQEYCEVTTRFFHGGVDGNQSGYARKLSQAKREFQELLEHGIPLPKDSMWVVGWDELTQREKDFMSGIAFQGWDAAQEFKNKGQEIDVSKMTQIYFEGCAAKRAEQRVKPGAKINFIQTASSEKIAKPSEEQCKDMIYDAATISENIMTEEYTQEEMEGFAKKNLTGTRLDKVLEQIKSAYGWSGDIKEWYDSQVKGCD